MSGSLKAIVVDYGAGNLGSVVRALQHCGCEPELASDADAIQRAERLVLPGVGAFGAAMRQLNEKRLTDPIISYARTGRPLFGICLGMQMLADESEEFGRNAGLGLIPGRVVQVPQSDAAGRRVKIPNIGWEPVAPPASSPDRWRDTVLREVQPGDCFYFVHSFHVRTESAADVLAETVYEGIRLTAAIQRDNVFGVQFHPEKSGAVGLSIIESFLAL